MLKIALCHFDWSMGPLKRNITLLLEALEIAGQKGANWVVTPETSVQGYYFHRIDKMAKLEPAFYMEKVREILNKYGMYLFLGCGEYVSEENCNYNTQTIIGPEGSVIGKHKKTHAYGQSEAWAACGTGYEVFEVEGIKVAPLVCADAWYPETWQSLKEQGAELVVDVAAWPPTEVCGNPLPRWLENTKNYQLPMILCNQTGLNPWMDMTVGQSVVIDRGELCLEYSGAPALLLFNWEEKINKPASQTYEVVLLEEFYKETTHE